MVSRFPQVSYRGSGAATRVLVTRHGRTEVFDLFGQDAERLGNALAPCSFAEAIRFGCVAALLSGKRRFFAHFLDFRQALTHRIRFGRR